MDFSFIKRYESFKKLIFIGFCWKVLLSTFLKSNIFQYDKGYFYIKVDFGKFVYIVQYVWKTITARANTEK